VFEKNKSFIQSKTRVNGVGSAVPVTINKHEDENSSRRVDFVVIINFNKNK
jgi:outer membrane protein OmpA-like peptidoglycan-associated protein